MRLRGGPAAGLFVSVTLSGCIARSPEPARPAPVAVPQAAPDRTQVRPTPPPELRPVAPPAVAHQLGLMPLATTGVDAWRRLHPEWDGRGVLIAILDSGLDPGVAGLQQTSTGQRKVLDLRDFSGEGDVRLTPVTPGEGGRITLAGGLELTGAAVLAASAQQGPWYGGILAELPFGDSPAADFNRNGSNRDRYGIVVLRAASGWVALVDLDADGSLDDERPIADYLAGGETFTFASSWAARGYGPITAALNLKDGAGGAPRLSVFLDTSGHGTHVAGVAAGQSMYGQRGFDGVAPGAQLIGLKIANNARGGVSTNGSMLRAMEYAADFAGERGLPLVMNLSFGIGNEQEGGAVMDSIVDAFLVRHPDVVFTIAAGNDGPGTSTMGLPGSASLALTAGAVYPGVFSNVQFGAPSGDVLGWWSSRGGELGKPDLVAPGMAYSTVPRWNTGEEIKLGTSFAAPHLAGLAALLKSALMAEGRSASRDDIVQAMRATARRLAGDAIDQGAGVPRIEAAWQWLASRRRQPSYQVVALGVPQPAPGAGDMPPARQVRRSAAYRRAGLALGDTVQRFRISRRPGPRAETLRLVSSEPWLRPASPSVTVDSLTGSALVEVRYEPARLARAGRHVGVISGFSDSAGGPAFSLVNTVIVPESAVVALSYNSRKLSRASAARYYVPVPRGASALAARLTLRDTAASAYLYLFEPSGRPARGDNKAAAGGEDGPSAALGVNADDLVPGVWEVVVQAMPGRDVVYDIQIAVPPVQITNADSSRAVSVRSSRDTTLLVTAVQLGVATRFSAALDHGEAFRRRLGVPDWALRMVVEAELPRDVWNRVTDFALTVFDQDGAQVGNAAMNYAYHRAYLDLPERRPQGYEAEIELFPGFASADVPSRVSADVRVSFVGEPRPVALPGTSGSGALRVPAGGEARLTFGEFTPLAPGMEWDDVVRVSATGTAGSWVNVERLIHVRRAPVERP